MSMASRFRHKANRHSFSVTEPCTHPDEGYQVSGSGGGGPGGVGGIVEPPSTKSAFSFPSESTSPPADHGCNQSTKECVS